MIVVRYEYILESYVCMKTDTTGSARGCNTTAVDRRAAHDLNHGHRAAQMLV